MGMFDTIYVNCPNCGEQNEFQTKSGQCTLECYTLEDCPSDALYNANRHSPNECSCGASLSIDINRRVVLVG